MSKLLTRRAALTSLGLTAASLASTSLAQGQGLPKVVVHKDPSCGCCGAWVDHIRGAGFPADVVEGPSTLR